MVFDNGNLDLVNAFQSEPNTGLLAETFTFGGATTFNTVRWFGVYASNNTPTAPDVFTISFFDTNVAGTPNNTPRPGGVLAFGNPGRVDTGGNVGSFDVYRYEATLSSPVTMGAGTFGIEIVNDTTADTNDNWLWATSAQAGNYFTRSSPTGAFTSVGGGNLAFQLINAPVVVPEAGTLALVLPALALFGAVVVRRRK